MVTLALIAMLQVPADSLVVVFPTHPVTVENIEGAHYVSLTLVCDSSCVRYHAIQDARQAVQPAEHWGWKLSKYMLATGFGAGVLYYLRKIALRKVNDDDD